MKQLIKIMLICGLSGVLLSACNTIDNTTPEKNNAVSDAEACSALERVFLKSADGFSSIREKPSYHNKITLWKSRYQMIEGSCEIWQWSDKYSYVCSRAPAG